MTAHGYHLAQLNIGRLAAPLDSAQLADFVAGLEPVNAAADTAAGFVWRLKEEGGGDATSFVIYDEPMILVNMSVWTDRQALLEFVYSDTHRALLRRRREFFTRMTQAYTVLWWVPAGHLPTVAEAQERLDHLRAHGPSGHAFRLADEGYPAPDDVPLQAAFAAGPE
jgi:Domain of unknown function (DUF3291)